MRLADVEAKKRRGKGAPKKAKSKGVYLLSALVELVLTYTPHSRQSENGQEAVIHVGEILVLYVHRCLHCSVARIRDMHKWLMKRL